MRFILYIAAILTFFGGFPCQLQASEVEWKTLQTLYTENTPLDVAVAANGLNIYILSEGGRIDIFGQGGKIIGSINVSPTTSGIKVSPKGDTLFLRDRINKEIQVISVNFIVKIDDNGSPTKGRPDASVQIALYNDFQ